MAFHIVNKQKDATFRHSTKPFIVFAIENEVRSKGFEYDLYLFDIGIQFILMLENQINNLTKRLGLFL